jgi:epoxyqueuosine reductase
MSSATASARDKRPQRDWSGLAPRIRDWGRALGFDEIGIAGTDLSAEESRLVAWLAAGRHGTMDYMARHGARRARPAELVPGTLTVITARLNYLPPSTRASRMCSPIRQRPSSLRGGRDYHKVLRAKLQRLATRRRDETGDFGYRVFTDSAGAQWRWRELEIGLARQAHAPPHARGRLVVLPRRDLYRPAADRNAPAGALRHAPRIGASVRRRSLRPYELDARRCIVPHDRARRQHSPRNCAR